MATKNAAYNTKAPKQTVSVTINSDLYAQAKDLGINTSQVAEEALSAELARLHRERIKAEILQDLQACNAFVAKYGSFADMVREHYDREDDE